MRKNSLIILLCLLLTACSNIKTAEYFIKDENGNNYIKVVMADTLSLKQNDEEISGLATIYDGENNIGEVGMAHSIMGQMIKSSIKTQPSIKVIVDDSERLIYNTLEGLYMLYYLGDYTITVSLNNKDEKILKAMEFTKLQ